jgi:hypothetical protein
MAIASLLPPASLERSFSSRSSGSTIFVPLLDALGASGVAPARSIDEGLESSCTGMPTGPGAPPSRTPSPMWGKGIRKGMLAMRA